MKVGLISQARMTASRLPGKVLLKINDKPLIQYHIDRLRGAGYPLYIATTINATDNPIVDFLACHDVPCYRGDAQNVLSRFYDCATTYELDVIVRLTCDCPLIDGALIRRAVETYCMRGNENLYLSNCVKRTYPRGFDFEIFSYALLKDAFLHAVRSSDLEHVTPYINKNRSGTVEFEHVTQTPDKSDYRITVDTAEDFALVKRLIEDFNAEALDHRQITAILDTHRELAKLNAHIEQKTV